MSGKSTGLRNTCFRCKAKWGECKCEIEVPLEEGFVFNDVTIVDYLVDETGVGFVNPEIYYGDVYKKWKAERDIPVIADETILQVNHYGWAGLYIDGKYWLSTNSVTDFEFRGKTYHDSVDYWGLTKEEQNYILKTFKFERKEV